MIRGKAKSLYENLKQKEGEGSKAGDNFRKRFGFRDVKISGEAASADQEAADEFRCN